MGKTNGTIKVWINNRQIIDFTGPIGRNDARTPYFKTGIYNPDFEPLKKLKIYTTNYNHTIFKSGETNGTKFSATEALGKFTKEMHSTYSYRRSHMNILTSK